MAKPRSAKIAVTSSSTWADRMDRALRLGPDRQRHIDALEGEAGVQRFVGECGLARGDGAGHAVAQTVEERAVDLALVRAHAAQGLQKLADRALLAEGGDAHLLERGFITGVLDRIEDGGLEALNVAHG